MNKIERLIADAETVIELSPWKVGSKVGLTEIANLEVSNLGCDTDCSHYFEPSDARHIVNTQPKNIIPILKAFLEMREALGKYRKALEAIDANQGWASHDSQGNPSSLPPNCAFSAVCAGTVAEQAADAAMEALP